MLLLPATVTAKEANDTRRLLAQALKGEQGAAVVVDASNLQHFDSAALAVLLECQRAADASGKSFALRHVPPKLAALARLYGIDAMLMSDDPAAARPAA
jgi:phospholipid transport system transporter-binding protein